MWILSPGDVFAGRYRILRDLGSGGMSHVFAARDEELGEKVALKIIKPELAGDEEFVSRFKREVRIARQLRHPNIVQVLEFGSAVVKDMRLYYLTMELLEGYELGSRLRRGKELALADTLRIGLQLCDALTEAHRAGVVHRDIKPQNIFVEHDGRIRLMDFGISRLQTLPSVTTGGQLIGTPKYMSPEQVHRKTEPDRRSDIYSLGIVLYELTTKRTPFEGQSTVELALKQVQEEPPKPTDLNPYIPAELEDVILKCLRKDPDERFQSAEELRERLQRVPSFYDVETLAEHVTEILSMQETAKTPGEGPTAVGIDRRRPETPAKTTVRRKRRRGAPAVAAVAAALALVALVGTLVLRDQPVREPAQSELVSSPPPSEDVTETVSQETPPVEEASPTTTVAPVEPEAPRQLPEGDREVSAVARGRLVVESDPSGATVHIDGRLSGTTPWSGELPPGTKRVTLSAPGFVTTQETVEVTGGSSVTSRVELARIIETVTVRFSANPQTEVYVDGELLGTIPPVIEKKLRTGTHRVRYVMPGYAEKEVEVEVSAAEGQEFSHRFPVPGSLRVSAVPYARVFLDGTDVGFTPVRLEKVSEGEHHVALEREGYRRLEKNVTIEPFVVNRFHFELVPEP